MTHTLTPEGFVSLYRPLRPFASDNLKDTDEEKRSVSRHARDKALGMRFIQTAPKGTPNLMVLDLDFDKKTGDYPNASWELKRIIEEEGSLPMPNYSTVNPTSGNAQLGFFIDGYVSTRKAKGAFNAIRERLTGVSGADSAYGGAMMRNPLHAWQETTWGATHLYTFEELNAYAPAPMKADPKTGEVISGSRYGKAAPELTGGRNTDTFNSLSHWAYKQRRFYTNQTFWEIAIRERANELNFSWENPMASSEVNRIVNHVTSWTWTKMNPEKFFEDQKRFSILGNQVKTEKKANRYEEVLKLVEAGYTRKQIADREGIQKTSAKDLIKLARKWKKEQTDF